MKKSLDLRPEMTDNEIMTQTTTPAPCPSCGAEQIGSYAYCTSCGIRWAALTPEAIARKAEHAATMRAKIKAQDEFLSATVKRLADEKRSH